MEESTSERLIRNEKRIIDLWCERVVAEVHPARSSTVLCLKDEIPKFLEQIVKVLGNHSKPFGQTNQETALRVKISQSHGKERATTKGYKIRDIMLEYRILKQVIFQVLEEGGPFPCPDREIILDAISKAKEDAGIEFVDYLRNLREKLVSTVTHDLRGPLTSSQTAAELILKKTNNPDCTQSASIIIKNMTRMDSMIRDILTASRLRAGEILNLEFKNFDLRARIRNVVDEYSINNPGRIRLDTTGGEIWGYWSTEIRRVLENLITNALKYGDPKTLIHISLVQLGELVELTVHNEGNPIPKEHHGILFEQFRRLKPPNHQEGWGLGLLIAKEIVEAHGGEIEVESSSQKGTDFRVTLPIREKPLEANRAA